MRRGRSKKSSTGVHVEVEASSGNVFADLSIPSPEIALAKADLVQYIRELIAARKLTQDSAGKLLGLDQPKVSALVRGNVTGYSVDRLLRFLNALGQQVEINIRPSPKTRSQVKARRAILVTH